MYITALPEEMQIGHVIPLLHKYFLSTCMATVCRHNYLVYSIVATTLKIALQKDNVE